MRCKTLQFLEKKPFGFPEGFFYWEIEQDWLIEQDWAGSRRIEIKERRKSRFYMELNKELLSAGFSAQYVGLGEEIHLRSVKE